MARVPNTPKVQKQAIKENKSRAIAGVKTVGKVTARVNANLGGKSVAATRPGLEKLAYKTAVAKESAKTAGVSPKKIEKVLQKSSK